MILFIPTFFLAIFPIIACYYFRANNIHRNKYFHFYSIFRIFYAIIMFTLLFSVLLTFNYIIYFNPFRTQEAVRLREAKYLINGLGLLSLLIQAWQIFLSFQLDYVIKIYGLEREGEQYIQTGEVQNYIKDIEASKNVGRFELN